MVEVLIKNGPSKTNPIPAVFTEEFYQERNEGFQALCKASIALIPRPDKDIAKNRKLQVMNLHVKILIKILQNEFKIMSNRSFIVTKVDYIPEIQARLIIPQVFYLGSSYSKPGPEYKQPFSFYH